MRRTSFAPTLSDTAARLPGLRKGAALLVGALGIVGATVACEPVAPGATFATRVNAAGGSYVSPSGVAFKADSGYVGGSSSGTSNVNILGTDADAIYTKHRWGMSGYRVAVPTVQTYRVRMHFAETVFTQAGKRVFDVKAEGALKLNDLDVVKKAGANRQLIQEFDVKVSDGTLDLAFGRVVEDPMVSAIEVLSPAGFTTSTAPTTPPPATTSTTRPPATTSTTRPPATTTPTTAPAATTTTGRPTSTNTGPRVSNPQNVGRVEVRGVVNLTDVVASDIVVYAGGQLTATNVRVQNTVVVLPQVGGAKSKVHLINSAIHGGITVNVVDGQGNLYWGSEVPVDLLVRGSWLYYHQGNYANGDHTEAVAGFGWPQGGRFENSSIVQQGPNNQTATATMNWHGADTVFDTVWFDWDGPAAAYFTVYVEGRNNVVRNSFLAPTGGYVYPSSSPQATYTNNRDLYTGQLLQLPG